MVMVPSTYFGVAVQVTRGGIGGNASFSVKRYVCVQQYHRVTL